MFAVSMFLVATTIQGADDGFPPQLLEVKAQMEQRCRAGGGRPSFVPDATHSGDVNGDGRPDWLLSAQGFSCHRRGIDRDRFPPDNFYCTQQQCEAWVFVSLPGRGHRLGWQGRGFNTSIWDENLSMALRADCYTSERCQVGYRWNGSAFVLDTRRRR